LYTRTLCRAHQALVLLKKEVELCRLQADIGKRVEEKISKDQRRYFLMEQVGGWVGGWLLLLALLQACLDAAVAGGVGEGAGTAVASARSLPAPGLRLQLKSIKKELGLEKDEKTALVQK
jgi:hypothetical protein